MSRRFYFTDDNAENIAPDYIGDIRGARTYAQSIANGLGEVITINDCFTDDIIDFVYPPYK